MMLFNINHTVRVKLTEWGRISHRGQWLDEFGHYAERWPDKFKYKPPVEDADGWSEWQLWELMRAFGGNLNLGCTLPFETNIEIVGLTELVENPLVITGTKTEAPDDTR